jgi:hypothetical protein
VPWRAWQAWRANSLPGAAGMPTGASYPGMPPAGMPGAPYPGCHRRRCRRSFLRDEPQDRSCWPRVCAKPPDSQQIMAGRIADELRRLPQPGPATQMFRARAPGRRSPALAVVAGEPAFRPAWKSPASPLRARGGTASGGAEEAAGRRLRRPGAAPDEPEGAGEPGRIGVRRVGAQGRPPDRREGRPDRPETRPDRREGPPDRRAAPGEKYPVFQRQPTRGYPTAAQGLPGQGPREAGRGHSREERRPAGGAQCCARPSLRSSRRSSPQRSNSSGRTSAEGPWPCWKSWAIPA